MRFGLLRFLDSGWWALKCYHVSSWCHRRSLKHLSLAICYSGRWLTSVEIRPSAIVSLDLEMPHPEGIIIGDKVKIGRRATVLQQVTIGVAWIKVGGYSEEDVPVIGDDVVLGAGCKVLGGIRLGNRVIVGANAVVTKSFSNDSIIAGVPAKIIGIRPAASEESIGGGIARADYCISADQETSDPRLGSRT